MAGIFHSFWKWSTKIWHSACPPWMAQGSLLYCSCWCTKCVVQWSDSRKCVLLLGRMLLVNWSPNPPGQLLLSVLPPTKSNHYPKRATEWACNSWSCSPDGQRPIKKQGKHGIQELPELFDFTNNIWQICILYTSQSLLTCRWWCEKITLKRYSSINFDM